MEHKEKNYLLTQGLVIFHLFLLFVLFYIAPMLFSKTILGIFNILVAVLFTQQLWALIHEGIHGNLSSSKKINNLMLSALSIFFGTSSVFLKQVHLAHHRYSRSLIEQVEVYTGSEKKLNHVLVYYFYLFIGLFLNETIIPLLLLLPHQILRKIDQYFLVSGNIPQKILNSLLNSQSDLRNIRRELLSTICIYTVAIYFYGSLWSYFIIYQLMKGFMISFFDYVYHYETPLGDNLHGNNLRLPFVISKFILHFNFHGIHHQNMTKKWHELPQLFLQKKLTYDGNFFDSSVKQLKGPLNQAFIKSSSS